MIVRSTAAALITGRTPGIPRHTGHTKVFGGAEAYAALVRQNILLAVLSCTWVSRPMTTR